MLETMELSAIQLQLDNVIQNIIVFLKISVVCKFQTYKFLYQKL
jgi:hypothetical protein